MIRTIVVDDEKGCREQLITILSAVVPGVHVVAEASGVAEAIDLIQFYRPDLVFLDISLGDGLGFDILERVNFRDFRIIFITAHDQYAIKAFRFNALDYILKPVDAEMVQEAMAKIHIQPLFSSAFEERFESLMNRNEPTRRKIALPSFEGITMVNMHEIIRCSSDGNYTTFYTTKGAQVMVSHPIKFYDELLTPMNFFRVHQSHLVNLDYVAKYLREDGGMLVMEDGSKIEVSRRRKDALLEALLKH